MAVSLRITNDGGGNSISVVNTRSAMLTFDGIDDKLTFSALVGGTTITSSQGTSTPTIDTGNNEITFTAGNCWDLRLSDGSIYPMEEGRLSEIVYDVVNGNHAALDSFTLSDGWCCVQNTTHYNEQMGHSTEILGSELHTDANAASDSSGNEADATTGFTSVFLDGTGANVFESQGVVKNVGNYALHSDCDDTPTNGARFYKDIETDFSLENGAEYKVSYDVRHIGTGQNWIIRLASTNALSVSTGHSNNIAEAETTWTSNSFYFTHVTGTTKYFGAKEQHADNTGGVYFDNFTIKKISNDIPDGAKVPALADGSGTDAIGNVINNPSRGYNKSLMNITN